MGRELGQQSSLEVPTLPAHFSDPVYSTASQRVLLTQQKDGKVWCWGKKEAGFTAEAKSCETTLRVFVVERTACSVTLAKGLPNTCSKTSELRPSKYSKIQTLLGVLLR